jgi:hypothetical protein
VEAGLGSFCSFSFALSILPTSFLGLVVQLCYVKWRFQQVEKRGFRAFEAVIKMPIDTFSNLCYTVFNLEGFIKLEPVHRIDHFFLFNNRVRAPVVGVFDLTISQGNTMRDTVQTLIIKVDIDYQFDVHYFSENSESKAALSIKKKAVNAENLGALIHSLRQDDFVLITNYQMHENLFFVFYKELRGEMLV